MLNKNNLSMDFSYIPNSTSVYPKMLIWQYSLISINKVKVIHDAKNEL